VSLPLGVAADDNFVINTFELAFAVHGRKEGRKEGRKDGRKVYDTRVFSTSLLTLDWYWDIMSTYRHHHDIWREDM
jgi:hypothetical protein